METTFIYSESAKRKAQKRKALEEGEAEQRKLAQAGKAPGPEEQPWEHRPPHPPGKNLRHAGQPEPVARPAPAAPAMAAKPAVRVVRKPQKSAAAAPAAGMPTLARPAGPASPAAPKAPAAPAAAAQRVRVKPAAAQAPAAGVTRVRAQPAASAATRPAVRAAGARPATARTAATARPATTGPLPAPELKASEERLLLESKELDLFGKGAATKVCVCPDCHHELVRVICLGTPVRTCLECKGVWIPLPVVRDFARNNEWFAQLGPAIQATTGPRATP